jgi:hypothetical protein
MPFVFNDPQHWLSRAAEARDVAARMKDPGARADLLAIADEYEKIAKRAAAWQASNAAGSSTGF